MKNNITYLDDATIQIELTKGQFAVADAADLDLIQTYKWYAHYSKSTDDYYVRTNYVKPNGKQGTLFLHRFLMDVTDRNVEVDHINGSRCDNRRSNLRICSPSENQHNRRTSSRSTTGQKNIHLNKRTQRYHVVARIKRKAIYCGSFKLLTDAIARRNEVLPLLHGKFANFRPYKEDPEKPN